MLTSTEIQKLFEFTRKKYVRYIDVQVELVDHLASSIEQLQDETPELEFDQALAKIYSRFPITGFNNLIQEKTIAMKFAWWHKLKDYILEFLTWPKVLVLMLIFSCLYSLSLMLEFKYLLIGSAILSLSVMIPLIKYKGSISKNNSEKFLCVEAYYGVATAVIVLPFQFYTSIMYNDIGVLSGPIVVAICFLLSIYLITLYALFVVFPVQLKEDVLRDYKEYLQPSA